MVVTDFLEPERLIVERLRERIPQLKSVEGVRDREEIIQDVGRPPAALVFYSTYRPATKTQTRKAVIEQVWSVVLAVTNARKLDQSGNKTRIMAGPLITNIVDALDGWLPEQPGYIKPLQLVAPGRGAIYLKKSIALFPLGFSIQLM